MAQQLTPVQFVAKWTPVALPERAASQEHFIDICRMLGQPTPAEHDATGAEYTFERGGKVTGAASAGSKGEYGFADVWWRGKFAWEYKRKGKYRNLTEAYRQLCQYREALENPPLLIVSDIAHTEIHTNFTGTVKKISTIELSDMGEPESLDLLRRVFTDPDSFKPTATPELVTREIAERFGAIARSLRQFGNDAQPVAHFLMKCMFCLFAEDVGLLPNKLFERLLTGRRTDPARLESDMTELFLKMKSGGSFGVDDVPFFNGGLFDDAPALRLTASDIDTLLVAARSDWGSVEPAIFGTLFERSLDPNTRAQIGAHYTSRDDILLVVGPVVMLPLRREWDAVKTKCETLIPKLAGKRAVGRGGKALKKSPALARMEKLIDGFVHRLASIRILDPACGSGNFLYVAIQQLLDLEKEVITFAARPEIALGLIPQVRPTQLHGIEINPYAAELAQVVIWIGYLQWMRDNGFLAPRDPILEPLQTIECRDAILDLSDSEDAKAADWPDAEFIIGNPPFLGSSRFDEYGISDSYRRSLHSTYKLHGKSDLSCYWFANACRQYAQHPLARIGLLATQSIRHGGSRRVLDAIVDSGEVFSAHSNRPWILDGAAIRVAIICFWHSHQDAIELDGIPAARINSDLSAGPDLSCAVILDTNQGMSFEGIQKGGPFAFSDLAIARKLLSSPNPGPQNNVNVVQRRWNASLLVGARRLNFIVDFGPTATETEAARHEAPFEYILQHVKHVRAQNKNPTLRRRWWIHKCPRPELLQAAASLTRLLVTPRVSEHRIWAWLPATAHADSRLFVFACEDDHYFGMLHSSVHEIWSLAIGAIHGKGNDPTYNNTTCFEKFALPWPPGSEPTESDTYQRVSTAAHELNEQRERWLNPPEWIDPIAATVDAEDDFADVPTEARELIRHSAIMARAAKDKNLKKRTLTNLYNERPTWLRLAHEQLDRAVLAAYAETDPEGDWSEDWSEVWTDTGAGFPLPDDHALSERRKETDQLVLANLLRLNLQRAGMAKRGEA